MSRSRPGRNIRDVRMENWIKAKLEREVNASPKQVEDCLARYRAGRHEFTPRDKVAHRVVNQAIARIQRENYGNQEVAE